MKAFLLYRDSDFDLQRPLPINEKALTQDLELNTLLEAMTKDDDFLLEVNRKAILSSCTDIDTLQYRQDILKDCIKNPAIVRAIYQIPVESDLQKRKHWLHISSFTPSGTLSSAISLIQMFLGLLKQLREIADKDSSNFESEGFTRFFNMIKKELDDEFFKRAKEHLQELTFKNGVFLSAELGPGNEGKSYVFRKPKQNRRDWVKRVFFSKSPVYSFTLHPRDDHGYRALMDIKEQGLNQVGNALAQSTDHIDSFINMLRVEMGFYIGCLNLYEQLMNLQEPICYPRPKPLADRYLSYKGLYDICLTLTVKQRIIGNDVDATGKELVIITGANQGGKSTSLRSIGLAQLMMQAGMFVAAESFSGNVCAGVYTHYKRKEDASMKSGKLDEELARMSDIADVIKPHSILLFNESFAATNEREGSEIARQIINAMLEKRIKIFFVTHMFNLAQGFYEMNMKNAIFLRAERKSGGGRTFRVTEGKPLQTSYGKDIYKKVFEENLERTE